MSLSHSVVSVGTGTPTQLTPAGREAGVNLTIQVQNVGSAAVYVGGSSLTSSSYGASLVAGSSITIDNLSPVDEVYALASTGTQNVAVLILHR